jgi:probable F420-dependent oxidoreductase
MNLGRVGIWTTQLRAVDMDLVGDAATAVQDLGYGALWIPGGAGGDVLERCEAALSATSSLMVATGILNVWRHDAAEVASVTARLQEGSDGRFVLALGISHQLLIGDEYVAPLEKMSQFLDQLDGAGQPAEDRLIAALRRRMLELARDRAAGSHPYFVPPEHTAVAREILGPGRMLAPEQTVVLETDPSTARETARRFAQRYLQLANYTNNLRALGYTDDDLAGTGSDRLIDAVVAWGDEAAIAARVQAHLDAGADHVCVQVIGVDPGEVPLGAWRALAPAVL